jgi:hypothetical protein
MEKNDIIIIFEIFIIIFMVFSINKNNKKENYDTGYNQNTTFRDCSRKLFTTYKDIEFIQNNIENNIENNNCKCDCNLQFRKNKFTL